MSSTRIREYTASSTDFEYFFRQQYDFSQDKIGVSPTSNRGTFCITKAHYAADLGTIYKFIGEAIDTNALFCNSYKNIEQLNTAEQNLYNLCHAIRKETDIILDKSVEVFERTIAGYFLFKKRYENLCNTLSKNAKKEVEILANRNTNGNITLILKAKKYDRKLSKRLISELICEYGSASKNYALAKDAASIKLKSDEEVTDEVSESNQNISEHDEIEEATGSGSTPINTHVKFLEARSEIFFEEDIADHIIGHINKYYN